MLKNYLITAFRNLKRNKIHTSINVFGLSVGLTCVILLMIFIQNELSYDKFNKKADRIFRILNESEENGKKTLMAIQASQLGDALINEFPEVESTVRIKKNNKEAIITYKERQFLEKNQYYVDSSLFQIFSYSLMFGDPKTCLSGANPVVISKEISNRLFGNENPIGKVISIENFYGKDDYKITGIFKDIPDNSHIKPNIILPVSLIDQKRSWGSFWIETYLLLREGADFKKQEAKLSKIIEKYITGRKTDKFRFILQPLLDIHFNNDIKWDQADTANIKYIHILLLVSLIILVLAQVNYINLSVSQYTNRLKEVSIRKVIGADKKSLFIQFIGESIILCITSFLISLLLLEMVFPSFLDLIGKKISLSGFYNNFHLVIIFVLLIGFISGSYPAIVVSSTKISSIFKGILKFKNRKYNLRNSLVILQFSISIGLLISFYVIFAQQNFMRNMNLGFRKENVIFMDVDWNMMQKVDLNVFKNELLRNSNVPNVTLCNGVAGNFNGSWNASITPEGNNDPGIQKYLFPTFSIDHDYFKTFGIEVVSGRDFRENSSADIKESFILNETAAKYFNWALPLGKKITWGKKNFYCIGVVKDFNITSLEKKIEPCLFFYDTAWWSRNNVGIKITGGNVLSTMEDLKKKWKEFFPEKPPAFHFLDADLDKFYEREIKMSRIFGYATIITILIASFGLLGIVSFSLKQKTKEIGIRKVLGSSALGITLLVTKEFMKLVIFANIIAWPIAYYFMSKWLQEFAYRIDLSIWIFLLSAGLAFALALLTIGFQALKAANANPVDALKYE